MGEGASGVQPGGVLVACMAHLDLPGANTGPRYQAQQCFADGLQHEEECP